MSRYEECGLFLTYGCGVYTEYGAMNMSRMPGNSRQSLSNNQSVQKLKAQNSSSGTGGGNAVSGGGASSSGFGEHSQYYIKNNRSGADIYEFEVPKWFDDMVQEYTIPQAGYQSNPLNQGGSVPKLTAPSTPGTSVEFPAPWIEWIEEYARNGRIISGGK